MLVSHRVNPLVALGENAESFFRMSRCSRRWRFSFKAASSSAWSSEAELLLPPAPAPPPAGAGGRSFRQAYRRLEFRPSSLATTSALLPLEIQFWTASRLKVMSYFRRTSLWIGFKVFMLYQFPNSLSVNSTQPQFDVTTVCVYSRTSQAQESGWLTR